jgi:hypothetical protein
MIIKQEIGHGLNSTIKHDKFELAKKFKNMAEMSEFIKELRKNGTRGVDFDFTTNFSQKSVYIWGLKKWEYGLVLLMAN